MFKHDKKIINCAQLGCHSFCSYSYKPRYTIMRNDVFVYLEIYSVYLEIYDYGVLDQGVRFPDVIIKNYNSHCRALSGEAAPSCEAALWLHWKGEICVLRLSAYNLSGCGPAGLGKPKLLLRLPGPTGQTQAHGWGRGVRH
jgi:hypothetical protein